MERELQRDDEWIVNKCENSPFRENVGDFTRPRRNVGLSDGLQGVDSLCVLLPNLHHLAKTSLADDIQQVKLIDSQRLMSGRLEVDFEMEGAGSGNGLIPLF